MKRFLSIILLVSVNLACFAQRTLEECQQLARQNYPMIKQLDLIEKSKEMNISNAAKAYLPQLSLTGMANLVNGMPEMSAPGTSSENEEYKLVGIANLTQTIWDGGATRAQRKILEASAEVDKQSVEVLLYSINERVNQLYFGILLIDEQLKLVDILDDSYAQNLKRAEAAYKNGTAFLSDLDVIKVELLNSAQSRIKLTAQRNIYTQMLSVMIGEPITSETTFSTPQDISEVIVGKEINRPELYLYEQQRAFNDAKSLSISARNMPKFGLSGYAIGLTPGMNFGASKFDHLFTIGVSVSWNIGGLYTSKNDRALIRTSKLMVDNQQETFLFNTKLELKQANEQIERSKLLVQKDNEIIQLRESIKRASETRYENGACTVTDLVNDINAENMARQSKALHELEYLMNLYVYKTTLGN